MTEYQTYRNGGSIDESTIKSVLAHYYSQYRQRPPSLAVHPSIADDVRRIVASVWPGLPVEAIGGAIVPEVWAQLPSPEKQAPAPAQLALELEATQ